jgi:integrase
VVCKNPINPQSTPYATGRNQFTDHLSFSISTGEKARFLGRLPPAGRLSSKRICELVKRRLKDAGLPSPHSFRVTAITDLLTQVPLEDVQYLAGHAEPRKTGLYDRRQKRVTRNIVKRIST